MAGNSPMQNAFQTYNTLIINIYLYTKISLGDKRGDKNMLSKRKKEQIWNSIFIEQKCVNMHLWYKQFQYYFEDLGLRNARIGFRQVETSDGEYGV